MGGETGNERMTGGGWWEGKADKAFVMRLFALVVRVEDCLLGSGFSSECRDIGNGVSRGAGDVIRARGGR